MPTKGGGGPSLFEDPERARAAMPLAARMRPRDFAEFVGQEQVIGEGSVLRRALAQGDLPSLIVWGPPGSGKTTLARLIAQEVRARFVALSAVTAGVAELRAEVAEARARLLQDGVRTVLFIDELHRFSRSQQDAILPHVEAGTVRLIGATTENPSLSINNALLSRCQVIVLAPLGPDAMRTVLERAVGDAERGLGRLGVALSPDALAELEQTSGGDARTALNALELAASATAPDAEGRRAIDQKAVREALLHPALRHDRQGDLHYDLASAMIKSVRGSDADAAVYWLARLIEAGEDPLFVARRIVISAAEDIGLADPAALSVAMAAYQATQAIGLPEARLPLTEAILYLALAPKSNSGLRAYDAAVEDVRRQPTAPVPLHLRNAVTGMMRSLGYGQGYRYAHQDPKGVVELAYRPQALQAQRYYLPSQHGREAQLGERWQTLWQKIHGERRAEEKEDGHER